MCDDANAACSDRLQQQKNVTWAKVYNCPLQGALGNPILYHYTMQLHSCLSLSSLFNLVLFVTISLYLLQFFLLAARQGDIKGSYLPWPHH